MYDVITIGTATRDAFFEGINFLKIKDYRFRVGEGVCLPFGSKMEVPKITFTTGGGGINTAVTFGRQGLKTAVVCRVGPDVSGEEIIRALKKEKINTKFVQKDKVVPTAYSVIFLTESGERTILSYKGAGKDFNEKEISWRKFKTRWFYIASLDGNEKLLRNLFSFAQKNKIKIAGNPGGRELEILKAQPELLNNYDVFVVNQEEASFLTDISYQREREVFKKLDQWVNGIVAMTQGPKGLMVSDGKTIWQAGTFKERKIVDRTGAGDAFASGFVAGLLQASSVAPSPKLWSVGDKCQAPRIEYAIRLGSANATAEVEVIGAKMGIINKKDFLRSPRWRNLEIRKIGY